MGFYIFIGVIIIVSMIIFALESNQSSVNRRGVSYYQETTVIEDDDIFIESDSFDHDYDDGDY